MSGRKLIHVSINMYIFNMVTGRTRYILYYYCTEYPLQHYPGPVVRGIREAHTYTGYLAKFEYTSYHP